MIVYDSPISRTKSSTEFSWAFLFCAGLYFLTYAVSGYPTKVIVDPKGNIVKIFLGESEEFYEFLDSLFKK